VSGNQPIGTELLYACYAAGTVSVPTTTPGSSMTLGLPAIAVPPGYMKNTGSWASSLKLIGGGLLIATATVPTFQFSLWSSTTSTYSATGTLIGQTAISAALTATTGSWFTMEWNIGLRTAGGVSGSTDSTSTVTCTGNVTIIEVPALTGTTDYILTIPTGASTYTPTCTTWPASEQVYLWPTISLGAATAGNTVTMEWLKLYGEN
jgi:hypothetical protein